MIRLMSVTGKTSLTNWEIGNLNRALCRNIKASGVPSFHDTAKELHVNPTTLYYWIKTYPQLERWRGYLPEKTPQERIADSVDRSPEDLNKIEEIVVEDTITTVAAKDKFSTQIAAQEQKLARRDLEQLGFNDKDIEFFQHLEAVAGRSFKSLSDITAGGFFHVVLSLFREHNDLAESIREGTLEDRFMGIGPDGNVIWDKDKRGALKLLVDMTKELRACKAELREDHKFQFDIQKELQRLSEKKEKTRTVLDLGEDDETEEGDSEQQEQEQ